MADIYIIDGTSLVYRSFYAIPVLTTSAGRPVNAVYGFANSLLKLLKEQHPAHLLVAFDVKGTTFRHELFKEYKIQRPPMPGDLAGQLPLLKEMIELFGIRIVEQAGCEADDLIAAAARRFSAEGYRVYILTGDKDMLQLLSDRVSIVNPTDGEIRDTAWFNGKFKLAPDRMADLLALAGDQSDNIPGVNGIGEKTAVKILQQFGSLEAVYAQLDRISSEKLRAKLEAGRPQAEMSRQLAALNREVPLPFSAADTALRPVDARQLLDFFERLEFKKLIRQILELFPGAREAVSYQDDIGFATGRIVPFAQILQAPGDFKADLENAALEKYGYQLKEKMLALGRAGVQPAAFAFDPAVARHLTGVFPAAADILGAVGACREELKKTGQERLFYEVEMPLIEVLVWMETAGIKVDREYLAGLSIQLAGDLEQWQNRIFQSAGETFNINSPQQLSDILFSRLGLTPGRKTKTGYSTDTSVLQELARIHPLPRLILEYRELFKLKSTYVDGLQTYVNETTGRIHPSFNQLITATGRLSCSNPNLQNIPIRTERGALIRKAFRADEGLVFYSFDYSQIELRILAHYARDPVLMRAFRDNKDIHQETADILFASDSLFAGPIELPAGVDTRRLAKTINFGIIYGMSPFGLSQEVGIRPEDARIFIDDYFAKFSRVKQYLDETVSRATRDGYVSTILGRRRYIPELNSRDRLQAEAGKRAAVNMPIQGSAADMIKCAMNSIRRYFLEKKLRSRLVLQIHDELLFEMRPDEAGAAGEIKEIMEKALPLDVPIRVDIKKGPNYLELNNLTG